MKLNKRVLKDIVKECLVEILAEGLVSGPGNGASKRASLNESIKKTSGSSSSRKKHSNNLDSSENNDSKRRSSYLDSIGYNQDQAEAKTEASLKNVQISNDPIMNEIFADTAATTLREQAETRGGKAHIPKSDAVARLVDESPLDDLFGNASQKWEALAFAPSITNK